MNPRGKSIFFATRPIGPPWDEASKNMVYKIGKHLDTFSMTLLTFKDQEDFLNRPTVKVKRVYPRANSRQFSPLQKLTFLSTFIASGASIFHFYFTPEYYTSGVIRFLKKFKPGKFLQTFATPIQNDDMIPKLVFGDAVVVQSDYSLNRFKKHGIRNVKRIYLAVDTDVFKPETADDAWRKELNISASQKVVLYGGNFYLRCNDDLIETILRVCRADRSVKFILACRIAFSNDLLERERMKTVFRKEGILGQVLFLERVANIKKLLALSDIHIFPPKTNFGKADIPMILLESLAMEKPIVITDMPPFNEIMKDDVGEVVSPGDVDSLVASLQKLLNNDSLRLEKGVRGRQMVMREFSLANYLAQYHALYNSLLGNGD